MAQGKAQDRVTHEQAALNARRHLESRALRQLKDKLDRDRRRVEREAIERWATSPPPAIDDPPPVYRP